MTRLLREPLVHFLLLGLAVFALHHTLAPPRAATGRQITVDAEVIAGLRADFARRAGRPPTDEEVRGPRGLVERYIEGELLYREALALGLDRGDVIVRRRLVQKMELVAGAEADALPPTEAELGEELAAHPERYGRPARVALSHVFLARSAHPDAAAEAARLSSLIDAGADPAHLGDPFLRGAQVSASSEEELAGIFGAEFAARAMTLPEARWSAPIASSYGLHLVRITAREPARAARVDEVRDRLAEAVRERRREGARSAALGRLRSRYQITVEPSSLASTSSPTSPSPRSLAASSPSSPAQLSELSEPGR